MVPVLVAKDRMKYVCGDSTNSNSNGPHTNIQNFLLSTVFAKQKKEAVLAFCSKVGSNGQDMNCRRLFIYLCLLQVPSSLKYILNLPVFPSLNSRTAHLNH